MNSKPIVNVGDHERIIAGVLGVIVLANVVRRAGPWRVLGAACLFYRAFTGNCKGYQALGMSTCSIKR